MRLNYSKYIRHLITIILISITMEVSGQFPFERFRKLRFKEVPFKMEMLGKQQWQFVAKYQDLSVSVRNDNNPDSSIISVFRGGKLVRKYFEKIANLETTLRDPLKIADINGDGLVDLKINVFNNGSGLAGSLETKIYFFATSSGFTKLSYLDFFSFEEVDINGDKNYEIIGCYLAHDNHHSYWTFDLYNYSRGSFRKVSRQYGYPIMIQYLYRENYKITKNISRANMRKFSKEKPGYDW